MKNLFTILGIVLLFSLPGCTEDVKFGASLPEGKVPDFGDGVIYNKEDKNRDHVLLTANATLNFVLEVTAPAQNDTLLRLNAKADLEKIVGNYNEFKSAEKKYAKDYSILPGENYELSGFALKKGANQAEATLKITGLDKEGDYGDYILPLNLKYEGREYLYLVFVRKDGQFSPITPQDKKPLPPGGYNCPDRKEPMKVVAYVETNNYDIRNYGQLILEKSKKPVFDFVVLFAVNMNYDEVRKRRTLFFNDKLQPIVQNPEKYIKPLTDRGIKVIIDILPNHQGVGFANFQNYEEALDFAKELKVWTDKLGIDGWDIDEEYAEYNKRPELPHIGEKSFMWYIRALKEVMPDKLVTLYDYGHELNALSVDEQGKKASDYIDYSWSNYWDDQDSSIGLPKERFGIFSIEANKHLYDYSKEAFTNLQGCYGQLMIFNMNPKEFTNKEVIDFMSKTTQLFYGEDCIFSGKYHVGPVK